MKQRVIGLSGLAGSGKDLFFTLLQKQVPNVQRFALADALKDEIKQSLINLYNIDITTCSRDQKNLVRPMLVAHGKVRRDATHGKYWTNLLQPKIEAYLAADPSNVACVTDIRYDVFKEDEIFWLKNTMKGSLVHLSLYEKDKTGNVIFVKPPNVDEAENDPKLQAKSNVRIAWPKLIGPDNKSPNWDSLSVYVTECLKFLNR